MEKTPLTAVALLSSGLDSSVALQLALRNGWRIACAITFDYGQRAAAKEAEHAARVSDHLGVPHRKLELPWFRDLSSASALLKSSTGMPSPRLGELNDAGFTEQSARAVWVPNRNGVLIEIASCLAEDLGAQAVIVGFNREEAATFPDNSVAYLEAITKALYFSTSNHVKVLSPTAEMDKGDLVKVAVESRFPFELLWSCYESGPRMCGRCESCMRLKRALANQGVKRDALFANPCLD